jgi:hypothetical protein
MDLISPKMVRLLTTAILRNKRKFYPGSGAVGVYEWNGVPYRTKAELKPVITEFCEGLTWDKVAIVKKNLGLI